MRLIALGFHELHSKSKQNSNERQGIVDRESYNFSKRTEDNNRSVSVLN